MSFFGRNGLVVESIHGTAERLKIESISHVRLDAGSQTQQGNNGPLPFTTETYSRGAQSTQANT